MYIVCNIVENMKYAINSIGYKAYVKIDLIRFVCQGPLVWTVGLQLAGLAQLYLTGSCEACFSRRALPTITGSQRVQVPNV